MEKAKVFVNELKYHAYFLSLNIANVHTRFRTTANNGIENNVNSELLSFRKRRSDGNLSVNSNILSN